MSAIEPREKHGWAIINPYGNIWSEQIFDAPSDAVRHLSQYARAFNNPKKWVEGFGIIRAKITVEVAGVERIYPKPFTLVEAKAMTIPHREYHRAALSTQAEG